MGVKVRGGRRSGRGVGVHFIPSRFRSRDSELLEVVVHLGLVESRAPLIDIGSGVDRGGGGSTGEDHGGGEVKEVGKVQQVLELRDVGEISTKSRVTLRAVDSPQDK